MKAAAFEELLTSVRQAGEIRRGRRKAARPTMLERADVKALRSDVRLAEEQLAAGQVRSHSAAAKTLRARLPR